MAFREGILLINLRVTTEEGEEVNLEGRFPDLYPYFRFEIRAPNIDLPHHQHPFGKGLCLLGRTTRNWNTTDTLADFIRERLPLVLNTGRSSGTPSATLLEEHQGEPFSDYYLYDDSSMILIDGSWNIDPSCTSGTIVIGIIRRQQANFCGVVLNLQDQNQRDLATAATELFAVSEGRLKCRWVRLETPIKQDSPGEFLKELISANPSLARAQWHTIGAMRYDVIGCIFPEEHGYQQEGLGWLFVVRAVPIAGPPKGTQVFFVRAGRAGKRDLRERTPELGGLADRTIAVFGTGGLGAPSTIELARSNIGEIRILDHDFTDPSTSVRWPLGLTAAGKRKVANLREFLAVNYPYTKVVTHPHHLGACREKPDNTSDLTVLDAMLNGADIIYDATAELGINHLLSDQAADRNIPYICVSVTPGAWGGRLIRVRPGLTGGCWMCHQWMIDKGKLPVPVSSPDGEVQPAGCADPTFTGAGFDIAEVALAGVRLVASTISGTGGYPAVDWDVAIVNFRDGQGQLIGPRWEFFALERHPECRNVKAHKESGVGSPHGVGRVA